MARVASVVWGAVVMLFGASARAEGWHLSATVETNFPVDVGVRVDVEAPHRLRLSTSLGVMPEGYVRAINGVSTAAGWYGDPEATLIQTALQSSLVWRTHLGWRPFPREGFTVMAGYGFVGLGGGASAQELIAGVTGAMIPPGSASSMFRYSVRSALHMVDVELGWEWRFLRDHLVVHTALGFAGTVSSQTSIAPEYTPRAPQATSAFTAAGERYLDGLYRSYVFTPVLSLGVGYRFF